MFNFGSFKINFDHKDSINPHERNVSAKIRIFDAICKAEECGMALYASRRIADICTASVSAGFSLEKVFK